MPFELFEITNKKPDHLINQPSDKFVLPKCRMGVEIEVEGLDDGKPEFSQYWEVIKDGSLRGNCAEFVTSLPMYGRDLEIALKMFDDKMKVYAHSTSWRTSTHIHIDMRDVNNDQLFRFLVIYLMLEKILFKYDGGDRYDSQFCIPSLKAKAHYISIANHLISDDPRMWNMALKDEKRTSHYAALNLTALFNYGSLEFRHRQAMFEYEELENWINMVQSIKKAAIEDIPLHGLSEQLSFDGPEKFLRSIFPENIVQGLFYEGIMEDLYEGVRMAQELSSVDGFIEANKYLSTPRDGEDYEYSERCISFGRVK